MPYSNFSLTMFLKNMYCFWKNSGTVEQPGDFFYSGTGVSDIIDTNGVFGTAGSSYSPQAWADLVSASLREVVGPFTVPVGNNVSSVTVNLDLLLVPDWVTDISFLQTYVMDNILNNSEEISVSNISRNASRVWTFYFDGLLNAGTQNLVLTFSRKKTSP